MILSGAARPHENQIRAGPWICLQLSGVFHRVSKRRLPKPSELILAHVEVLEPAVCESTAYQAQHQIIAAKRL
jgi:hypothetical protein